VKTELGCEIVDPIAQGEDFITVSYVMTERSKAERHRPMPDRPLPVRAYIPLPEFRTVFLYRGQEITSLSSWLDKA
jgi:hypothetical protein